MKPTFLRVGIPKSKTRAIGTVRPPTSPDQTTVGDTCATYTYEGGNPGITTHPWNIPSTALVGDLCFMFVQSNEHVVSTVPSGWNEQYSVGANAGTEYAFGYSKVLTQTDIDGGLEFSLNSASEKVATLAVNVRGAVEADYTLSGPVGMDAAEHDPPAVTPSQGAGDYYVLVVFHQNKGSFGTSFEASGPTGYTAKCEAELAGQDASIHMWQATKSITTSENPSAIDWTDTAGGRKYANVTISIPTGGTVGDIAAGDHTHPTADVTDVATASALGQILVSDGDSWEPLTVGSDGETLEADSGQPLGVKWAATTSGALGGLSDVTITGVADDEVLCYDLGSGDWVNQTAAEAGLAAASHTHTESDVTDLDHWTETDHDALDHSGLLGVDGGTELLMQDGVTSPPVPIETEARDDWLYEDGAGGASGSTDADEDAFFAVKAAILDPDAYTFEIGTTWSTTVPTGKAYYLLGAWNIEPDEYFMRRALEPVVYPEGATLESNGSTYSHAYYCDPSAVTATRAKYFERMMRLEGLTLHTLTINITSGTTARVSFPSDFTDGLLISQSVQDLAWLGLSDSAETYALNIWEEVSDDHGVRFAGSIMFPFKRTSFPKLAARRATDHSLSSGWAGVTYVKLPGDW